MLIAFSKPQDESILIQVQYQPGQKKIMARKHEPRTQKIYNQVQTSSQSEEHSSPSTAPTEAASEAISGSDIGVIAFYPRMSRILKETGKVLIEIAQNQAGSKVQVYTSSGYERLDESALQAAQKAFNEGKFSVYLKERNQIQVVFIFRLVEK